MAKLFRFLIDPLYEHKHNHMSIIASGGMENVQSVQQRPFQPTSHHPPHPFLFQ
jgi:hypothetical protein